MVQNLPKKATRGATGRLLVLLFEHFDKVAFNLFEIVFPAKPAQEFQGIFRWMWFHQIIRMNYSDIYKNQAILSQTAPKLQ